MVRARAICALLCLETDATQPYVQEHLKKTMLLVRRTHRKFVKAGKFQITR